MRVWRLPVHAHPMAAALFDLVRCDWKLDARDTRGDLKEDIDAGPPLGIDRPEDLSRDCSRVIGAFEAIHRFTHRAGPGWAPACSLSYPAGGGLGWHTNSAHPGWRLYVPLQLGVGLSGLLTEEEFHVDDSGTANLFRLGPGAWHAVVAYVPRICFGVNVPDDVAADLTSRYGQMLP